MPPQTKRAVALLSSGLDSSVAMDLAHQHDCDVVLALTFDYGQRAAAREIAQAKAIASHLGIPHRVIRLDWFSSLTSGGGLLTDAQKLPQPTLEELSLLQASQESAKAVWVPNRNGVFIEVAASIAEDLKAQMIIVGFNQEEAATFPDNSQDYLIAITHALSYSTANQVVVNSPTARLHKKEIVAEAIQNKFPLELVWSCYENRERMCGRCESCMRFKRALAANQVSYESWFEHSLL